MIISKKSLGIQNIVEIELDQNSDKAYISENGIISHNCKHCRKFYLDEDQSPALYRISTLLNNGTNYGKKTFEWKAVVGATHPNDRESGVLELRPGWKVGPEGTVEYIGLEKWDDYIKNKLRG